MADHVEAALTGLRAAFIKANPSPRQVQEFDCLLSLVRATVQLDRDRCKEWAKEHARTLDSPEVVELQRSYHALRHKHAAMEDALRGAAALFELLNAYGIQQGPREPFRDGLFSKLDDD